MKDVIRSFIKYNDILNLTAFGVPHRPELACVT